MQSFESPQDWEQLCAMGSVGQGSSGSRATSGPAASPMFRSATSILAWPSVGPPVEPSSWFDAPPAPLEFPPTPPPDIASSPGSEPAVDDPPLPVTPCAPPAPVSPHWHIPHVPSALQTWAPEQLGAVHACVAPGTHWLGNTVVAFPPQPTADSTQSFARRKATFDKSII